MRVSSRWMRAALFALVCLAQISIAQADYIVQLSANSSPISAEQTAKALRNQGLPVKAQPVISVPNKLMIRLFIGPYSKRSAAEQAMQQIKALGIEGFIRKYEPGPTIIRGSPHKLERSAKELPPEPPASLAREPAPQKPEQAPPAQDQALLREIVSPNAEEEQASPVLGEFPASAEPNAGLQPMAPRPAGTRVTGFFQSELAYTTPAPSHRSKFRHTLDLSMDGGLGRYIKWRVGGRVAYDAVFDMDDYYSKTVKDDQRLDKTVRETYLDISAGDWDLRLGRQHIIWGEMVGLFFADVVSAKDLREFVLQDFDWLRIPQWAARAEYFRGDFHGELLWIPYMSYDDIGVPGAEFYPYPPPSPPSYAYVIQDERQPHGNNWQAYGSRLSYVQSGWDVSAFYYDAPDTSPVFFRNIVTTPAPAYVYQPDHDRIRQWGGTLSKDFDMMVLKAEAIYTQDQWFNVLRASDADGVVRQNRFDYVLGLEYTLPQSSRVNVQLFQRWYPNHDPDMQTDSLESGYSLYSSTHWPTQDIEPQFMFIQSINRKDWLARPKLMWKLDRNWRLTGGADYFGGSRLGLFGRYDKQDRVYAELRYMF